MTKTINDVYMQLFRRLKEGGDPMPQLTAREITAYACKADKKQTAGWSHFYVEDTTVDYAGLLCDRCLDGEPLAYIIRARIPSACASWSLSRPKSGFHRVFSICAAARVASVLRRRTRSRMLA